jgi:hypothetical protein
MPLALLRSHTGLDQDDFDAAAAGAMARGWIESAGDDMLRLTEIGHTAAGWAQLDPTPLRKAARKLKGPTSSDFEPKAWAGLLEREDCTPADRRLMLTAVWIATQSNLLRETITADRASLGAANSTILAVGAVNRDFHAALAKHARATRRAGRRDADGLTDMDRVTALPLNGPNGQPATLEDIVDAAGDAVESWLYDACAAPAASPGSASLNDSDAAAVRNLQRYSIQHGLHDLWQQALWEGWELTVHENRCLWTPSDRRFALLFDAWQIRNRSNALNFPHIAMMAWREAAPQRRRELNLPSTVTGIERLPGRRPRVLVGRPAVPVEPPSYLLARECLAGSYLADFLARPLPNDPDLTCDLLLKAWHVLADLAEAMAAGLKKPAFVDASAVRKWALAIDRKEVVDVLGRALGCGEAVAERLTAFLTWQPKAYKGAVGQPDRAGAGTP